MNEPIQTKSSQWNSPLARAYCAAVLADEISRADAECQVANAAAYILQYGVANCTADVLRVVAAMCEAMAELKREAK